MRNGKIYVKREDLSCPMPGPSFSKIRGLYSYLRKLDDSVPIGVLDTLHSKAGWGAAYLCHILGLQCFNFYPFFKREIASGVLRENQQRSATFGAYLIPLCGSNPGFILNQYAKKMLAQFTDGKGVMLPVGLKLDESVDATAEEVSYTPDKLLCGTWVVSISSGTIAAGIIKGLVEMDADPAVICHMGYSARSQSKVRDYIKQKAGHDYQDIQFIDEGYEYKDKVEFPCPFPCNSYYDLKAWKWLMSTDITKLAQPIVFWNIGA